MSKLSSMYFVTVTNNSLLSLFVSKLSNRTNISLLTLTLSSSPWCWSLHPCQFLLWFYHGLLWRPSLSLLSRLDGSLRLSAERFQWLRRVSVHCSPALQSHGLHPREDLTLSELQPQTAGLHGDLPPAQLPPRPPAPRWAGGPGRLHPAAQLCETGASQGGAQ